jgi:hypothetical protein
LKNHVAKSHNDLGIQSADAENLRKVTSVKGAAANLKIIPISIVIRT